MAPSFRWAAMVPELACSDVAASLRFYVGVIGFAVAYERPGFAYLALGDAQLMLEAADGAWTTGELARPFGRGINLQIEVADAAALVARLERAGVPLFRSLAEIWYRAGDVEDGQREFLVQDPDGYLPRFAEPLGERPTAP